MTLYRTKDTQRCTRCKKDLPLTAFGKDKSRPYGLNYRCRDCMREANTTWCKNNLEKCRQSAKLSTRRLNARKAGYEMLDIDNSVCSICSQEPGDPKNYLVTDHDHKTMKTRGVLCRRCNLALGNFDDDVARLKAAIRYLEESV